MIRDIYTQVSKRPDTLCNFLEGTYVSHLSIYHIHRVYANEAPQWKALLGSCGSLTDLMCFYPFGAFLLFSVRYWGDGIKLIYRHYATLYFVFAVDQQESDLGILDLIQVFVETLDKIFENVCELDLIFHSDKVHYALDEIVMGGMVLETNINEVLTAVNEMTRLDNASTKRSLPGAMKK